MGHRKSIEEKKATKKAYRLAHKEEIAAWDKVYSKAYRLAHKTEIDAQNKISAKAYRLTHRKEIAARDKIYRLAHKEEIAARREAYGKIYRPANRRKKVNICSKCGGEKELNISCYCKKCRNEYSRNYIYERKVRLCQLKPKNRTEEMMILRRLLSQTEKALREGNREALSLLKKKFEQLPIMAA